MLDRKLHNAAQARVDASKEKVQAAVDNFVRACKEGHQNEVVLCCAHRRSNIIWSDLDYNIYFLS